MVRGIEKLYFRLFRGARFVMGFPVSKEEAARGMIRREQWKVPMPGESFYSGALVGRPVFRNTGFGQSLLRVTQKR